ncbi:glycosyltransferase family A protein [Chelatococcus daeguensis]|uniref:glycosyltransferase family A protein n=1 Tax=Chelatococcus daeguensis TaxID=444444 RepID=UPI000A418D6A|nr:glycosyltransferase family A protein [Chelatococcus daeguensis]
MTDPRITFGIIVLNGEPFTRYTLEALYPFAHEIIVVEGAAYAARGIARSDGHSRDGTLEVLREFKARHDADNKITIVTAEDEGYPDGFWPGEKDEQSRAYAKRATGEYLWQIDIDEFYRPDDMKYICHKLKSDKNISTVTFKQITFWGSTGYAVDGWYLRRGASRYHRLFKWGPGYSYVTHRPPTVHDERGVDLREIAWLRSEELERDGIFLYHYSLLFPKQVKEKCDYYESAPWAKRARARHWAENAYLALNEPFRVHNVYDLPSWLDRYVGPHPPIVLRMMDDLRVSNPGLLRDCTDVEHLLSRAWYNVGKRIIRALDPFDAFGRRVVRRVRSWLKH